MCGNLSGCFKFINAAEPFGHMSTFFGVHTASVQRPSVRGPLDHLKGRCFRLFLVCKTFLQRNTLLGIHPLFELNKLVTVSCQTHSRCDDRWPWRWQSARRALCYLSVCIPPPRGNTLVWPVSTENNIWTFWKCSLRDVWVNELQLFALDPFCKKLFIKFPVLGSRLWSMGAGCCSLGAEVWGLGPRVWGLGDL